MQLSGVSQPYPNIQANRNDTSEAPPAAPLVDKEQAQQGEPAISWQAAQPPQLPQEASTQTQGKTAYQPGSFGLNSLMSFLRNPGSTATDTGLKPEEVKSPEGTPSSKLNTEQMSFEEVISALGRNENLLKKPLDRDGLEKLRDASKTPSDLGKAVDALLNNADYYETVDKAKEGKSDGKISGKDVQNLQEHPQIRAYADFKAHQYQENYVPSDSPPGSPARAMTQNDAMRELYLYSESLPKNINLDTLRNIADGSEKMGKCPPQLAAAAKFFAESPDRWQAFSQKNRPSETISRDRLSDLVAFNVKLSAQENRALETLKENKEIFFKGGAIKLRKLESIANNEENNRDVRDAANLLSQPNSMLFSMLDNGKHGAGGNFFNKANDRHIGKGDLDAFVKKGTNQVAEPTRASTQPVASAQNDMAAGQETQPDLKKEKGGQFTKMLEILSYLASAAMMLIPGAGIAGATTAAARAAATATGRVVGVTSARETANQASRQGTREAIEQSARDGAKEGVREGLKDGVQDLGIKAAKDLAKYGADRLDQNERQRSVSNPNVDAPRVWAQS